MKVRSFPAGLFFLIGAILSSHMVWAQKDVASPVYVDGAGVMRWQKDKSEVSLFGVNYTVPFAYGYRSHKALGKDIEKAIDADVYHLARLGLDAFRVHMWDVEITDSLGNLLQNEHLRLFDYLIYKLGQRKIHTVLTPIAFWGNGYPEPDEKTPGFSTLYGKRQTVVNEKAIQAQENYIRQLLQHVNPYTGKRYAQEPRIIAMEINNEPHHSGPKPLVTSYVNRLARAAKAEGWRKPIFYNISESPAYADAVAAAGVEGHSFQWYPTGLVAGRTLRGNYLPHVDAYTIPFGDTIPAFRKRSLMVYEFDAGDVLDPVMYPAMARSFRRAGFQWATQFAYDPMATAYANTEYQTHYLNLAYTPAKAISLLIAGEVFRRLPRGKEYGPYPSDSTFGPFRVSYRNGLSEMNAPDAFYYTGTTATTPVAKEALQHIAGVGSSSLVRYEGSGAYFLDKLATGVWRLEVMPDAAFINDPFAKASPGKEVARVQWNSNRMEVRLEELGARFRVKGLNHKNEWETGADGSTFLVRPGTYLLYAPTYNPAAALEAASQAPGVLGLGEFSAPLPVNTQPYLYHQPSALVRDGVPLEVKVQVVGADTGARVALELRHSAGKWKTLELAPLTKMLYGATVPADLMLPGLLNYRILYYSGGDTLAFPGGHRGNPYAWDAFREESYETVIADRGAPVELFNASFDRKSLALYNPDWKHNTVAFVTAPDKPRQLVYRATVGAEAKPRHMGWQLYIGEKGRGLDSLPAGKLSLVIRARTTKRDVPLKVALLTKDAFAFATKVVLDSAFHDIVIPLSALKKDKALLLPRPYPGFLPLYFEPAGTAALQVKDLDKLELSFEDGEGKEAFTLEIESVLLKQER